jgi:undecaprenyl-diphosphatase
MESINQTLFLWINASAHPSALKLDGAVFLAQWAIWAIPVLIALLWLVGKHEHRQAALAAAVAGVLGLALNQIIGLAWPHPRPFMMHLGHTFLVHAADPSFPSDHLTLWWSVAFTLAQWRACRTLGMVLGLLGVPVAWARIYLGVHFPLDMIGALLAATLVSWLMYRLAPIFMAPLFRLACAVEQPLFRLLFARRARTDSPMTATRVVRCTKTD